MFDDTVKALSSRHAEVFALWTAPAAGGNSSNTCAIRRVIVPDQESHVGVRGAHVHVPGRELRRIAFDNYERGERSAVQIHTHPSADTRMSLLDVKWEVVVHTGALSIIVPDYCRGGPSSFERASVYERQPGGRWRLWGAGELGRRVRIQ